MLHLRLILEPTHERRRRRHASPTPSRLASSSAARRSAMRVRMRPALPSHARAPDRRQVLGASIEDARGDGRARSTRSGPPPCRRWALPTGRGRAGRTWTEDGGGLIDYLRTVPTLEVLYHIYFYPIVDRRVERFGRRRDARLDRLEV